VTALLVEDDEDVRSIARRGLEKAGYRVYTIAGVEEALAVAATTGGPIHLLVTDVVMPGGSGQVLADRLLTTFPALKVLFISGYFDDALAGPEVPGASLLQKPFSPDDLVRKVRELLDRSAAGHAGLCDPCAFPQQDVRPIDQEGGGM
jgi:DNA-binding response OmpR family regulator